MQLYGTITSERATKGQGGKYLDIKIQTAQKNILAEITARAIMNDGMTRYQVFIGNDKVIERIELPEVK